MKANKITLLLLPGKDHSGNGPGPEWQEQLAGNLTLLIKRYTGSELQVLSPGKGKVKLPEGVSSLVFLSHESYDTPYLQFLKDLEAEKQDKIRNWVRIDTSAGVPEKIPDSFEMASSIELFETTTEERRWLEEDSGTYWSRLLDLAYELKETALQENVREKEGDDGWIYLAQAGADVVPNREILKRELLEHGFRVVPESDLRARKNDLKSYVQGLADKARLVIHLLGNQYGESFKDTGNSLAEAQLNYVNGYLEAIENDPVHSKKDLERLIWIDPEFNPEDVRQEELINQMKRNIEKLVRTEIIQTPIELFKSLVIRRLRKPEPGHSEDREAKQGKLVYILHSLDDGEAATSLAGGLSKAGWRTGLLDYEGKKTGLLGDHKTYLRECHAALVYYRTPNRPWLRSKVMDLLKAPGLGRAYALESRMVVAGEKDTLEDYSMPGGISLIREEDTAKAVNQVLKNLNKR